MSKSFSELSHKLLWEGRVERGLRLLQMSSLPFNWIKKNIPEADLRWNIVGAECSRRGEEDWEEKMSSADRPLGSFRRSEINNDPKSHETQRNQDIRVGKAISVLQFLFDSVSAAVHSLSPNDS